MKDEFGYICNYALFMLKNAIWYKTNLHLSLNRKTCKIQYNLNVKPETASKDGMTEGEGV